MEFKDLFMLGRVVFSIDKPCMVMDLHPCPLSLEVLRLAHGAAAAAVVAVARSPQKRKTSQRSIVMLKGKTSMLQSLTLQRLRVSYFILL